MAVGVPCLCAASPVKSTEEGTLLRQPDDQNGYGHGLNERVRNGNHQPVERKPIGSQAFWAEKPRSRRTAVDLVDEEL